MSQKIIELLKDDSEYYRGIGKQYLSNSDIKTLLKNPRLFGMPTDDNISFLKGRYFHQSILEPDKAAIFDKVDASTRNTNIYKDFISSSNKKMALLKKEADEIDECVDAIMNNLSFYDEIRDPFAEYEVPAIGEIYGIPFKGKADIVKNDFLIDLKTTADIEGFRWNAKKYGYDSQAFIYQQLFGLPLYFMVVDVETKMLGMYKPSQEFVNSGMNKVIRAIEVYDKFFSNNKSEDITQFFYDEVL